MKNPKSIVIWGGDDILSTFVESLIASHAHWQAVYVSIGEGLDILSKAIEKTHPDIVILLQAAPNGTPDLALQLLHRNPAVKVIVINLENNAMHVYCKRKILAAQASDLIAAIESER